MSPTSIPITSIILTTHQGRQRVGEHSFLSIEWLCDVIVSVGVLLLPIDSRMEVDELVKMHMGEMIDLISSIMPNESL